MAKSATTSNRVHSVVSVECVHQSVCNRQAPSYNHAHSRKNTNPGHESQGVLQPTLAPCPKLPNHCHQTATNPTETITLPAVVPHHDTHPACVVYHVNCLYRRC